MLRELRRTSRPRTQLCLTTTGEHRNAEIPREIQQWPHPDPPSERDYSHAWMLVWNDAGGRQHEKHGFSGSAQMAQKYLSLTPAPGRTLVHAEVVPVEVRAK